MVTLEESTRENIPAFRNFDAMSIMRTYMIKRSVVHTNILNDRLECILSRDRDYENLDRRN
jgi:hypothetical protein